MREHADLLVGRETFDDAGVFRLSDDLALVQTVDFFAPIVDDPYAFGQIAAANALSDVYAMGGEPITAMAIVAFPTGKLPLDVLTEIMRGGQDAVTEAGAVLVGGHSITDDEVKFGLSVTGRVHPGHILTNAGARAGDVLILTKPLGTGILATAVKRNVASAGAESAMISSMRTLNKVAAAEAVKAGVRCATDITGFGLVGHASHIARASDATLHLTLSALPLLDGVVDALSRGVNTGGADRNLDWVRADIAWGQATAEQRAIVVDPQTSGGLLVAAPPEQVAGYLSRVPGATVVGRVAARGEHLIVLE